MAALGLDDPAHLAGIFLFPFRDDVIVGFHFEQAFEDERKALGGRLLERQNLDVVVVHAQMPAMAFDGRFGKVVVEEGVVLEFGEFEFVGMEVERSLENAEGFLFVEHPNSEEVADLEDEAAGLLKQRRLGVADVLPKNDDLLLTRKMRPQIGERLFSDSWETRRARFRAWLKSEIPGTAPRNRPTGKRACRPCCQGSAMRFLIAASTMGLS